MQAKKLRHGKEQEQYPRSSRDEQVLPFLPQAHSSQGKQVRRGIEMKKFMKALSILLAVLLAMTLSFTVLAEGEESTASTAESTVSTDASAEASTEASASESKAEESKTESKAEESKAEESKLEANKNDSTNAVATKSFPWARVITLIAIVVLVIVLVILAKTNTALGQKINKFFKEYWSEIKKVSWSTPKDTLKATAVVLVFIVVAAAAIGVLDLIFTGIINGLAKIFN
jgi:preprotein translocase SecE subunit